MENIITKPAKKTWQKPDFYLVGSSSVAGGAGTARHEVNTGNGTKVKTDSGSIISGGGSYNAYVHS